MRHVKTYFEFLYWNWFVVKKDQPCSMYQNCLYGNKHPHALSNFLIWMVMHGITTHDAYFMYFFMFTFVNRVLQSLYVYFCWSYYNIWTILNYTKYCNSFGLTLLKQNKYHYASISPISIWTIIERTLAIVDPFTVDQGVHLQPVSEYTISRSTHD